MSTNPYLLQLQSQGIQPAGRPVGSGSTNPYLQQLQAQGIQPSGAPSGMTPEQERYQMIQDGQAVSSQARYNRTGKNDPTLGGQMVRDLGRVVAKPIESMKALGNAGKTGSDVYDPLKSKYLGDTYGIGLKPYADVYERQEAGEDVTRGDFAMAGIKSGLGGAAYGAELGSYIGGIGAASTGVNTLKTAGQQGIKQVLKQSGKVAGAEALAGLAGSMGYTAQQEDATAGQVIGSGLLGASLGAGVAFAVPVIGASLRNVMAKRVGAEAAEKIVNDFAKQAPKYDSDIAKFSNNLESKQSNKAKSYNLSLASKDPSLAGLSPEEKSKAVMNKHAQNLASVLGDGIKISDSGKFNYVDVADGIAFKRDSFMDNLMGSFRQSPEPVRITNDVVGNAKKEAIDFIYATNKEAQGKLSKLTNDVSNELETIFKERGISGNNAKLSDLIDIYQKTDVKYSAKDPISSYRNAQKMALKKTIMNIIEKGSPNRDIVDLFKMGNKTFSTMTETMEWANKMGNSKLSKLDSFMLRAAVGFGTLKTLPALGPLGFLLGAQGAGIGSEILLDAWINTFKTPSKALRSVAEKQAKNVASGIAQMDKASFLRQSATDALEGFGESTTKTPINRSVRRFLNKQSRKDFISTKAVTREASALERITNDIVDETMSDINQIYSNLKSVRNQDEALMYINELQTKVSDLDQLFYEVSENKKTIFSDTKIKNQDTERAAVLVDIAQSNLKKLTEDLKNAIPKMSEFGNTLSLPEASNSPMQMGGKVIPQVGRKNRPSGLFR